MAFTDWLSEEMRIRGWSQAKLAREAGITKGALSHIFSGTRNPGVLMLKSIARALHLPVVHVFEVAGIIGETETEIETDPQPISDLDEWVRIFVDADPDTRERLLAAARSPRKGRANPSRKPQ